MMRYLVLGFAFMSTPAWAASADLGSQLAAGKQLFETTCAASTCHGSGGEGGNGPKLIDRNFSLEAVRIAVTQGRAGTPMPAFKDLFDADMSASVIAYVLSISTGGRWATAVPVEQTAKAEAAAPWPAQVAVGAGQGSPAAGYALFYDATRATACRSCHSYRENGGPVGADFAGLNTSAAEIFTAMAKPGRNTVTLTTRAKVQYAGIKGSETNDTIRLIDVSVLPPVTRSFVKADVVSEVAAAGFDHAGLGYTPQELRDAAAFLGVRTATVK